MDLEKLLAPVRLPIWILKYHWRSRERVNKESFGNSVQFQSEDRPRVTVLVTTLNNMYGLETTLRSAALNTSYPEYEFWVVDKESTDATLELLKGMVEDGWPIRILSRPASENPALTYDYFAPLIETPFWVVLHDDVIFLAKDWLSDLVATMVADSKIVMAAGEVVPEAIDYTEPVNRQVVDLHEAPCTWVLGLRKSIRDIDDTSFVFAKQWSDERNKMLLMESPVRLLLSLEAKGYRHQAMPDWYQNKYHHIGNLSWIASLDRKSNWAKFKRYQRKDLKRRALRLRSQTKDIFDRR